MEKTYEILLNIIRDISCLSAPHFINLSIPDLWCPLWPCGLKHTTTLILPLVPNSFNLKLIIQIHFHLVI